MANRSEGDKKHFEIEPECTKCGHRGKLFISDASIAAAMKEECGRRAGGIWAALILPRMIASWAAALGLGFLLGWGLR